MDFDWVWVYEVFQRRYPELMKTYTVKTPNGYRLLYFTKNPENDDTWKNSLHVELQGGKPAIVYGKAQDESDKLQEYKRIGTYQIKHEPKIQETLRRFLTELQESCEYLTYPCVSSKLKHKKNQLSHDQRLHIANFLSHKVNEGNLSFEDARDFFKTCPDYNVDRTTYHLEDTLKKIQSGKLKPPRCQSLQKSFQWTDCQGCPRRSIAETSNEYTEPDEIETPNIDFKYPTKHLTGFENLEAATGLYGEEYTIIFKALYYQLLSYQIRKSTIHVGQVDVDCRIPVLIPIRPGHGKTELKNLIRDYTKLQGGSFGAGDSLHAEQMIGRTVRNASTKEYEHRLGYLSEDYFVADEAYKLLNSQELHWPDLRKYVRIALDQFPKNILEKGQPSSVKKEL